jgi:AraC-type transcriptional regulator N-terminus
VPVESQIVEASEDAPLLSLLLRLDMSVVREVLMHEDLLEPASEPNASGLAMGRSSIELLEVCSRLIDLLSRPQDIPFMSGLIEREIIYRLLCSPQGQRLRSIATSGDLNNRTCESHHLAEGELQQASPYGRAGKHRARGSLHLASPVPCPDFYEPPAVSENVAATRS